MSQRAMSSPPDGMNSPFVKLQLIRSSQSVRTGNKKKQNKNPTGRVWTFVHVRKQKKRKKKKEKWIAALFFSEHYESLPFGRWSLPHRAVPVKMHSVISPSSRTRRLFFTLWVSIRTFTLFGPLITSQEFYHAAATTTVQTNSMNHPFEFHLRVVNILSWTLPLRGGQRFSFSFSFFFFFFTDDGSRKWL